MKQIVTAGNQSKYLSDGVYYKLDYLGYESAAEYLASVILKYSNIQDYVLYDITGNKQTGISCTSDDFMKIYPQTAEFISVYKLLINSESDYLSKVKNLSCKDKIKLLVETVEDITKLKGFGLYLTGMLEFDAIIRNEDRHLNNIGLIKVSEDSWDFAPVFDNGGAFMSDITETTGISLTAPTYKTIKKIKAKPFSSDFEKQVNGCRELYGSVLKINADIEFISSITKALSRIREVYGDRIAERAGTVLTYGMKQHPENFITDRYRDIRDLE